MGLVWITWRSLVDLPEFKKLMRSLKGNEVLKVMNDCGKKVVFVPPYSPQYNPIEHVFSSMKASFRRMQEEESEIG